MKPNWNRFFQTILALYKIAALIFAIITIVKEIRTLRLETKTAPKPKRRKK
jgi:large-conductance mechanosensitive channel